MNILTKIYSAISNSKARIAATTLAVSAFMLSHAQAALDETVLDTAISAVTADFNLVLGKALPLLGIILAGVIGFKLFKKFVNAAA